MKHIKIQVLADKKLNVAQEFEKFLTKFRLGAERIDIVNNPRAVMYKLIERRNSL